LRQKYTFNREISGGNFGQVYEATSRMKDFTHYAIKKLTKHEKSSSDYREEVEILK
jgi:hypothetical protein